MVQVEQQPQSAGCGPARIARGIVEAQSCDAVVAVVAAAVAAVAAAAVVVVVVGSLGVVG